MYIQRFLEKEILKYIRSKEVIAVVGARQCGKTTLLRHIFEGLKKAVFLDFEDRETLEMFENDIKSFIELYVKPHDYLFMDEFQYAKDGGKNLKYIVDNHRIKIFVSGSSSSALSIHGIKYLVGRVFVFNLYPLSFDEYLSYKDPALHDAYSKSKRLSEPMIKRVAPHFSEFCIYGGYPRVVLSSGKEEKETVLRNIYNTYFLREIREILNLPDDHKLSKLINALALQTGNMISYNELSELTGFRYKELLSYINVLEKTFVCIVSRPFHTNKRTELAKSPKIFFVDNGFRNISIKNFQPARNRQDKGALHENFVASEIAKKGIEVKYWRSKSKAEVDFVIEKDGRATPVEVKSDLSSPKITRSFHSFVEKYRPNRGLVLSEHIFAEKQKTRFAPIFSVSREL